MKLSKINKKGGMGMVLITVIILFSILIIGFTLSITTGVLDYTSDTLTPILTDLGVAGDTNISAAAAYTVVPINTFVQAMPWIVGFMYVVALIFSVVFVVTSRDSASPMFMGVYFFLIILLIFAAIIMSNMYQDILVGSDEIATRLSQQTLMNYMILYSPFIMALIGFISGIYLFTNRGDRGSLQ